MIRRQNQYVFSLLPQHSLVCCILCIYFLLFPEADISAQPCDGCCYFKLSNVTHAAFSPKPSIATSFHRGSQFKVSAVKISLVLEVFFLAWRIYQRNILLYFTLKSRGVIPILVNGALTEISADLLRCFTQSELNCSPSFID